MSDTSEPIKQQSRGFQWRTVIHVLLRLVPAALLLAFILQNRAEVTIQFLVATVYTSLIWALLIAAGLGFVLGFLMRDRRS